jgi:hypothetical protein
MTAMNTRRYTSKERDKLISAAQDAMTFAVVGAGMFPVDMLRYDKAWPASESDSRLISNSFTDPVQHRIELRSLKEPTPARWRSFGWTVVAVNGERVA